MDPTLRIDTPSPRSLCSADEGQGTAGGGGGNAGGQAGNAGAGDSLDPNLRDVIMRTVNAAVTSQLSRKLPEAIASGVTEAMGPINSRLDQLLAQAGTPPAKGKGKGEGTPEGDPRTAELENQVKALSTKLAEQERAAKEAAIRQRDQRAEAALRASLAKVGVRPELIDGATAILRSNLVAGDDDKAPTWKAQRNGYTEDLAIEAGIGEWLASDTGKAHLAPAPVSGSGAGRGVGGAPPAAPLGGRSNDPATAKLAARQAALTELGNQVKQLVGGGTVKIG